VLWAIAAISTIACTSDRTAAPRQPSFTPSMIKESGNWGQRGRIVDATILRHVTKEEAAALLAPNATHGALDAFDPRYDVDQYAMSYTTINERGEPTVASAAVFVPIGAGTRLPLVSFSHGTQTDKQKVPSTLKFINPIGIINAAHGSVAILADYVGMGVDAAHIHPYLVAQVGADASLDALRAAKRLLQSLGIKLDGRLFVYGYSQGGQVAMALLREIEREPRSGFTVTAAAPGSGPYAFGEVTRIQFANPNPPVQKALVVAVPFLFAALQDVYHIAGSMNQVLIPPFDEIGERMVTEGMTDAEVAALPFTKIARDMLRPEVVQSIVNDPNAPFLLAMRANETYDFAPRAPVRMYYTPADALVHPLNTLLALQRMRELGARDVDVIPVFGPNGESVTHGAAQWLVYNAARRWFDSFPVPITDDNDDR
jgi:dienelactone hydrolase